MKPETLHHGSYLTIHLLSGTHALAIVKAKEDYETLRDSFANVIADVNKLIANKQVTIDGRQVPIDIFLGGDYKFLLIMMGMKSATSHHSCIYCKGSAKER